MARSGHRWGTLVLGLAAAVIALVVPSIPAYAAGGCATPGRDGTATLNGVINTYYPGSGTAAAASTTITLGAATGAATPIAIGDLVLVIQMQDAAINSTNTGAYGDGVAGDPATGWTALNSAGLYEYAVATSAVPLAGGVLTVSSGLINTYTQAAPTATQGQRDFQVIRVPQYVAATLTAGLTAAPFNGSTGGVLVFDVAAALNLNGAAVSVNQSGFRAGLGRQLAGGAGGTGTDYVNLSANPFHAQKGEGIAGTPQYTYNSLTGATGNTGVDGYPNGSTARGAPGTAGGGGTDPHPTGNDQNTGGGGGANGGTGGIGGTSGTTNLPMGGFGGTAFPATAVRVTAGAGGGAGTRNNSGAITNASSGGSGGGIVMIRTGSVAGAGSITADGGTGVVPDNDGGGGGGAGGSVVVVTQTGGLAGLTISARGGAGANAWPTSAGGAANYHGPGGGGGGGVVLTTSAPTAVSAVGGVQGTTTVDAASYGATPGTGGTSAIIAAAQIPGAGSGASCVSDQIIAKSHIDPFVRGGTYAYGLTVSNIGGAATSGTTTMTDTLPAGLTPVTASGTGWTCAIVGQTVTCTSTAAVPSNGSFPVISITVNVAQSAPNSVTNTATVSGGGEVNTANDTASDPTNIVSRADIAVTKIASSGSVPVGSTVTFTVTARNLGPSDATGVQVTDVLPAGLTFVSAAPASGTYTAGTGVWNVGAIANGASTTLTITATVTATGTITNTALKTAETEVDPNPGNDSGSVSITGTPTAGLPGPPSGGMAQLPPSGGNLPTPLLGAGFAGFLGLLLLRRRSQRIAIVAGLLAILSLTTIVAPLSSDAWTSRSYPSRSGSGHGEGYYLTAAQLADVQRFGKPISTVKPEIGVRVATLHPATGPLTPYRLRIPALNIDTLIEPVGVTARRQMDVPANIWNAAWLRSGVKPGAPGQAVIDGHLDSVAGTAVFGDLHRLRPGDRIYVSDEDGGELTFRVTGLQVAPLDGFPTLRVFGPAQGRFLNLITCAGHYDPARRTYDRRLVVFAELM
jgi:uncharacterized repeat protein (TIGR01451 family)